MGAALITDVKRNALDDGPGIRSTVFFKGCPLRCEWCQNPETLSAKPQLQRQGGACIACGRCAEVCPQGAVTLDAAGRRHDDDACQRCGRCVEACAPGALRVVGDEIPARELADSLLRDEPFYRNSGGGVTFSGGEPTLYLDYLVELAAMLSERGVHLLLQTCGQYRADDVEQRLLPLLDMVYFDLKLVDPAQHRRHAGVDNSRIQGNLARLARLAPDRLLVRMPLVPGITDGDDNLRAASRRVKALGLSRLVLLPYNPTWLPKRRELGLALPYDNEKFMSPEQIARCEATVRSEGVEPGQTS